VLFLSDVEIIFSVLNKGVKYIPFITIYKYLTLLALLTAFWGSEIAKTAKKAQNRHFEVPIIPCTTSPHANYSYIVEVRSLYYHIPLIEFWDIHKWKNKTTLKLKKKPSKYLKSTIFGRLYFLTPTTPGIIIDISWQYYNYIIIIHRQKFG